MPASLQWVLVNEELRHVSDFRNAPPSKRPVCTCVYCGEVLTLRLGKIRAHHAAHRPKATCALARRGESTTHFNAKHQLAALLRQPHVRSFGGFETCTGRDGHRWSSCSETRHSEWASAWDQVLVEHTVGRIRLDVALMKDGQVLLGIEIYAKNKVSEEKAGELAALQIPWVEVPASDIALQDGASWDPSKYLAARAGHQSTWCCSVCSTVRAREKVANDNGGHITDICQVHLYYPNGNHYIEVFARRELRAAGKVLQVELLRRCTGHTTFTGAQCQGPYLLERITVEEGVSVDALLEQCFQAELAEFKRKGAEVVDVPAGWLSAGAFVVGRGLKVVGPSVPSRYLWKRRGVRFVN